MQLKETDVGTDYILVFPPEIRYQINHGEMVITESSGEVVRITHGQNVDVGGGEVDSLNQLGSEITSQIPDNCSGRFWFVSSITPK